MRTHTTTYTHHDRVIATSTTSSERVTNYLTNNYSYAYFPYTEMPRHDI